MRQHGYYRSWQQRISGVRRVSNQDGTFTAMTYTKSKTFKTEMVPVAGWKETQVSDMDFDTIWKRLTKNTSKALPKAKKLSAQ